MLNKGSYQVLPIYISLNFVKLLQLAKCFVGTEGGAGGREHQDVHLWRAHTVTCQTFYQERLGSEEPFLNGAFGFPLILPQWRSRLRVTDSLSKFEDWKSEPPYLINISLEVSLLLATLLLKIPSHWNVR